MENIGEFSLHWMAGLDPAIQSSLDYLVFFWMAASKGGHDDGIGGNIRVIKFRDDDDCKNGYKYSYKYFYHTTKDCLCAGVMI